MEISRPCVGLGLTDSSCNPWVHQENVNFYHGLDVLALLCASLLCPEPPPPLHQHLSLSFWLFHFCPVFWDSSGSAWCFQSRNTSPAAQWMESFRWFGLWRAGAGFLFWPHALGWAAVGVSPLAPSFPLQSHSLCPQMLFTGSRSANVSSGVGPWYRLLAVSSRLMPWLSSWMDSCPSFRETLLFWLLMRWFSFLPSSWKYGSYSHCSFCPGCLML